MIIAPSILAADFSRLAEHVRLVEAAGADWFHVDIMDGHFVPNISFGPAMVETMRGITDKFLDVHLMISDADKYIEAFSKAGADLISVHVEACDHLHSTVASIKNLGKKAGVVLNPATSLTTLENIITDVDLILLMTVNPGFGGQKFIPETLPKITRLSKMIAETGKEIHLEVDGGVDVNTTPEIVAAGARVLVAGSAVFGQADVGIAFRAIEEIAGQSLSD